jgi:hypothetical protein
MNVPRSTVAALSRRYGPQIRMPAGLDGTHFMWAESGAESTFGDDCTPRHEVAYDKGGYYYLHSQEDEELVEKYGSLAASSFGPWQMLLINAPGCSPEDLDDNPEKCAQAFASFVNRFVIGFRRAQTLEQMAQTYNSGNFYPNPPAGVLRYGQDVRHYYDGYPLPVIDG